MSECYNVTSGMSIDLEIPRNPKAQLQGQTPRPNSKAKLQGQTAGVTALPQGRARPASIVDWQQPRKKRQLEACRFCQRRSGRSGFAEQLVDIFPVHQMIHKRLQVIRAAIA